MILEYSKLDRTTQGWLTQVYRGMSPYKLTDRIDTYEVRRVLHLKGIEDRRRAWERAYEPRLTALLAKVGREVALEYTGSGGSISHSQTVLRRELQEPLRALLKSLYEDVETEFVKLVPVSLQAGKAGMDPDLVKFARPFGFKQDEDFPEFGPDDWDLIDPLDIPKMMAYNRNIIAMKIARVSLSTARWIAELVRTALDEGMSVDQVAAKLRAMYGFSSRRAKLIAQTEVVGASNAATFFSIDKNAPTSKMTKDWINAGDHRVRNTHVDAGFSQIDIPFRDPFEVGGSHLMFPGDASLGAAGKEIIGCRCTALYQTPGSRRERIDRRRRERANAAGKT